MNMRTVMGGPGWRHTIRFRIFDEVPIPEGLTYGRLFRGPTGREEVPSVLHGDKQIGQVKLVKNGWRKGQWRVDIWPECPAGPCQYSTSFFFDRERAIAFLKIAAPEMHRP